MAFDIKKFNTMKFKDRTADVPVPDLAEFFGKDEDPVWTVRGLTGKEMARVNEAVKTATNLNELISRLVSDDAKEKAEAIKETLGMSDGDTPADLIRRIHMLKLGSVEPKVDQQMSVKMADAKVEEFYNLTNKIIELSGRGKVSEGESTASGATKK